MSGGHFFAPFSRCAAIDVQRTLSQRSPATPGTAICCSSPWRQACDGPESIIDRIDAGRPSMKAFSLSGMPIKRFASGFNRTISSCLASTTATPQGSASRIFAVQDAHPLVFFQAGSERTIPVL